MKILFLFLIISVYAFAKSADLEEQHSTFSQEENSEKRDLCVVNHGATYTRFDRCRTGEVMVEIQNLTPMTIRCAQLLVNCKRPEENSLSDR